MSFASHETPRTALRSTFS